MERIDWIPTYLHRRQDPHDFGPLAASAMPVSFAAFMFSSFRNSSGRWSDVTASSTIRRRAPARYGICSA